jgi:hypothetical protein
MIPPPSPLPNCVQRGLNNNPETTAIPQGKGFLEVWQCPEWIISYVEMKVSSLKVCFAATRVKANRFSITRQDV